MGIFFEHFGKIIGILKPQQRAEIHDLARFLPDHAHRFFRFGLVDVFDHTHSTLLRKGGRKISGRNIHRFGDVREVQPLADVGVDVQPGLFAMVRFIATSWFHTVCSAAWKWEIHKTACPVLRYRTKAAFSSFNTETSRP
jgi:hypothetical protein